MLNSRTVSRAPTLWRSAADAATKIILLSPEMLRGLKFQGLLGLRDFKDRLALIGIDELHLLFTWGVSFRQAFLEIGRLRARLMQHTRFIGLTATLLPEKEEFESCGSLGFPRRDVYIARRSNRRSNISMSVQVLNSALDGYSFPDLDWLLHRENAKVLVFCRTIARAWRLCIYLWGKLEFSDARAAAIRPYSSLMSPEYNAETRALLQNPLGTTIVASTNALAVGVDMDRILFILVLDVPEDHHAFAQLAGRAVRGCRGTQGYAIFYVTKKSLEKARLVLSGATLPTSSNHSKKSNEGPAMSRTVADLLLSDNLAETLDRLYQNPPIQNCHCKTCNGEPICGLPPSAIDVPNGEACSPADLERNPGASVKAPRAPRNPLTVAMRDAIVAHLKLFRESVWDRLPDNVTARLPQCGVISDEHLAEIAAQITKLDTEDKLRSLLATLRCKYLTGYEAELFAVLRESLNKVRGERAAQKTSKNAAPVMHETQAAVGSHAPTQPASTSLAVRYLSY